MLFRSKLVLISPLGIWRDDHPTPDLFEMPYLRNAAMLWASGAASPQMSNPADDPNDEVEKQILLVQAWTTVAKFVWPLPDRGLRRRLRRIAAETLLIAGAKDVFVPAAYLDDFKNAIAGARAMTVANAAHMVAYEQLDEVFQALAMHVGG